MKRLELFEFEDFHWLPRIVRTGVTSLIPVLHKLAGTADILTERLSKLLHEQKLSQITDLGSGSGGPMLEVIQKINVGKLGKPIQLVLTDFFPDPQLVESINNQHLPNINYSPNSVDATNISEAPDGLKTMIASFHHMNPETAKKILHSAEASGQSILIYEIAKNNIPFIVWLLLLPISLSILVIMSLLMTPFARPLSIGQLVLTYLIPVIPLVYAWDGQASLMRTYTFEDITELLGDRHNDAYRWTIEDAKKANGKKGGYCVIGNPTG